MLHTTKTTTWLMALGLLAALGCDAESKMNMAKADSAPATTPAAQDRPADTRGKGESSATDAADLPTKRMVIRKATVNLEVEEPEKASAAVAALITSGQGFIVSSQTSGAGSVVRRATMTARVPSSAFETTLAAMRKVGTLRGETISGQDVTEEFVDLQARLRTQRALEQRFVRLLTETQTVESTIRVEQELARVRGTIERMQGRSTLLQDQVKLSTITVHLHTPVSVSTTTVSLGREVSDALHDAWEAFVTVIGMMIRIVGGLLPVAIFGGTFIAALHAWWRRRGRAKGSEA